MNISTPTFLNTPFTIFVLLSSIFINFVDLFSFPIGVLILLPILFINLRFKLRNLILYLCLFILCCITFVLEPGTTYYFIRFYFPFLYLFLLISSKRIFFSLTDISSAALLYLFIVILYIIFHYQGGRLNIFGDPNQFALILVVSYIYVLYFFINSNIKFILHFLTTCIFLFIISLTESIGGFLFFLIISIYSFIKFYNLKNNFIFLIFIIIFFAYNFKYFTLYDKFHNNFNFESFSILIHGTFHARLQSILVVINQPITLFGHGFHSSYNFETPPHSFLVLTIYEVGIFGFAIISLLLLSIFWNLIYSFNCRCQIPFLVFHNRAVAILFVPFLFLFPSISDLVFITIIGLAFMLNRRNYCSN